MRGSSPAGEFAAEANGSMLHGLSAATPVLDRATMALLLAFVGTLHFSIAVSQAFLAAALLCAAAQCVRDRVLPAVPVWFWPLLAYAAASLLSAAFSLDPLASLQPLKKLLLFLIVPLIHHLVRQRTAWTILDVTLSLGAVSAALGIFQYAILNWDFLGRRPQGSLSHYMTYSGLLMLVICVMVGRLIFTSRQRTWPALVMPALLVALVVTFTRSAWVGAGVGVGLLLVLRDFRLVALLPIVVAIFFATASDALTQRMASMFDLKDPTNRDRVAMMKTGAAVIADYPLTGVGPNMIERVYPQYRAPEAVEPINVHLHNVPLQIAAERGLIALAAWLWFVVALIRQLVHAYRSHANRVFSAIALAAVAAMLAAGMFEHNFGDSEFLMLFLVLVTLPFAVLRPDRPSPSRG